MTRCKLIVSLIFIKYQKINFNYSEILYKKKRKKERK